MLGLLKHLRFAGRQLRRNPTFTGSVILLLGLGVGSVTTIFTLVDHLLLRPLPYPLAERLFVVQNGSHSGPDFQDFQGFRSVEAWATATTRPANVTGLERPARMQVTQISPDFFRLFAARPALGRLLVADDFRTGEGILLSHGTWRREFGDDPAVIGRSIRIDGAPAVVVGVLDESFVPPEALVGTTVDAWRPIDPAAAWLSRRSTRTLAVAGRLREGSSLATAAAEAEALAVHRAREFPDDYVTREGRALPLPVATLQEATVGGVRTGLRLLLGAVSLLLLVVCINVAHLFLARGLARVREMSIRRALGAGTGTLTGNLLLESLLVAGAGAAVGVVLATLGLRAFLALSPATLPRADALAVDVRVMGFAIAVAVTTALLFGLLPVVRLTRWDEVAPLRSGDRSSTAGRGANRIRTALVAAEVALSLILVIQAGSLLRSLQRLHLQDLGFRTEGVWTIPLRVTGIEDSAEWVRRMEGVRASLAETPGVRAATFGLTMPLEFTGGSRCCWSLPPTVAGTGSGADAQIHPVESSYFSVLGLPIVAGSGWAAAEVGAKPQPAVLTEALAIELFGSAERAVERELRLGGDEFRVAGVVQDNLHFGPDQPPAPSVYLPITALPWADTHAHMAVLVDRPDPDLAERLREAVWRAEPDLPVTTVRPLTEWAGHAAAGRRFESLLFACFGVVALLLIAGGLYGSLLYAVGRRRRELGIRLALGATPAQLKGGVVWQGLRTVMVGCVLGVAGGWSFGRLLESRLFGIGGGDPGTLAGSILLLLGVALIASWWPASRAAATDPIEVLRAE